MATHITTLNGLQAMKDDLAADYVLDNDIDASATSGWNGGAGFIPVGQGANLYTGNFDGQNHTINNLHINRPGEDFVGLFGAVSCGVGCPQIIKNVRLYNCTIKGRMLTAALVGSLGGEVSNCYATGNIEGTKYVGGLIGRSVEQSLSDSYFDGSVKGTDEYTGGLVGLWTLVGGGLVGNIKECFSKGDVTGVKQVGGLVGASAGAGISLANCYSHSGVEGDDFVGGLVGNNALTISKCYSVGSVTGNTNVGGLVGNNTGTVSDSFWDTETSGQAASDGGTGKTTDQMNTKSTFTDAGWDFNTIWDICDPPIPPYPWLQWQEIECEAAPPEPPPLVLLAPHDLLCEQKKNPTDVRDPQPEFSAVHRYE